MPVGVQRFEAEKLWRRFGNASRSIFPFHRQTRRSLRKRKLFILGKNYKSKSILSLSLFSIFANKKTGFLKCKLKTVIITKSFNEGILNYKFNVVQLLIICTKKDKS